MDELVDNLRQELAILDANKKSQSRTRKANFRLFAILVILTQLITVYHWGMRKDGSVAVILFALGLILSTFLKSTQRRVLVHSNARLVLDRASKDAKITRTASLGGGNPPPPVVVTAVKERAAMIGRSVTDAVGKVKRGINLTSPRGGDNTTSPRPSLPPATLAHVTDKTRLYEASKSFLHSPGLRLNAFAGIRGLDFNIHVKSTLNEQQVTKYDEFNDLMKERVKELRDSRRVDESRFFQSPDDFTKLRFLQSDGYDVTKALARLTETLIWRNQPGSIDDFVTTPDLALLDRYRVLRVRRLVGLDKLGRPLLCERLGEFLSGSALNKGLSIEDFIRCYSFDICEIFAAFREAAELTGQYRHRVVYIGDLAGMKTMGAIKMIPFLKTLASSVERHFVELAGPLCLINAPYMAPKLWQLIKPFLDPQTASQVMILSGPAREQLLQEFGADVLPVEFGGCNPYTLPHAPTILDEEFEKRFPYARRLRGRTGSVTLGKQQGS